MKESYLVSRNVQKPHVDWLHQTYNWLNSNQWAPLWLTAIATCVLAAGVFLAWLQLVEARKQRQIQVLSDFGQRWDSERLVEARDKQAGYDSTDLAERVAEWLLAPADAPDVRTLLRVPNFFEDLAIMVDLGELKIDYVAKAFKASAEREWAYWHDAISAMQNDTPASYSQFEALVNRLAEHEDA